MKKILTLVVLAGKMVAVSVLPILLFTSTVYGSIVTQSFYRYSSGNITPPSGEGPVGTLVYIAGTGASASSLIAIDFGTHRTITTITSNNEGSFSTSFVVDTQAG
ncbi:hypothetical protein KKG61_07560, partial [bacterium]|nr:hypothetical protein [bacterium]